MKQELAAVLRRYQKKRITDQNLSPSAVLIPLFLNQAQCHVLFTKRSLEVKFHKGQICFPGGAREPVDASLVHTALREAEEEIGLKAKDVEILGELDDSETVTSRYVISPFVAFIPYPYPFKFDDKEVERIISVPLSALMDETNFRQESLTYGNTDVQAYYYNYRGDLIWGATAKIVKQFVDLLRSEAVVPY